MEDPLHNEGQELDEHVAPHPVPNDDEADGSTDEEESSMPVTKEEEYLSGWRRAQADYANLQKETERLRGEYAKYAASDTIDRLLPVLDNLSKAVAQPPDSNENAQVKAWIDGVGHIRSQFAAALKETGVRAIDEAGVPFDPSIHEALMREAREGTDPDVVLTVIEAGYTLHDKVLRPAKVIVSQ